MGIAESRGSRGDIAARNAEICRRYRALRRKGHLTQVGAINQLRQEYDYLSASMILYIATHPGKEAGGLSGEATRQPDQCGIPPLQEESLPGQADGAPAGGIDEY